MNAILSSDYLFENAQALSQMLPCPSNIDASGRSRGHDPIRIRSDAEDAVAANHSPGWSFMCIRLNGALYLVYLCARCHTLYYVTLEDQCSSLQPAGGK